MDFLEKYKAEIDLELNKLFENYTLSNFGAAEETLKEAMHYAATLGGKRIRPILGLLCFEICQDDKTAPERSRGLTTREDTIRSLLSVELIHAFSLVHDDLPAMDNDELRRGKPSVWKKFGEEVAILVGDALQTLAFENLASSAPKNLLPELVQILAEGTGLRGMTGGQARDLSFEKNLLSPEISRGLALDDLIETHKKKTGSLILVAAKMGGILGGSDSEKLDLIEQYAENIGLAFQIKDDLLDFEGDAKTLGKETQKDFDKKGFVKILGLYDSKKMLNDLIEKATSLAVKLQSKKLEDLSRFITDRKK